MTSAERDPIVPSLDPENEPTDANPVPVSPTDPKRRPDEDNPDEQPKPGRFPDPRVVSRAMP